MNTAEKRAQLDAAGEPWPDCDCHGESMSWQRNVSLTAGGYFYCRIVHRIWQQKMRTERHLKGACIYCGRETATESMCRPCADSHADGMAQPKQKLQHQFADMRYRRRQRAGGEFQPTGAGLTAFTVWLQDPTGEVD